MFRLMRNTHLAIGLGLFLLAVMFAFSSVVLIYRPWFSSERQETEQTVTLSRGATAREAALELMREHGVRGDLRDIGGEGEAVTFRVFRPGTEVRVTYSSASGEARLESRRYNFYETMVQLHVNHGFWHDFMASNLWSLLSVLASMGMILLGASGIYLWYKQPKERTVGLVLIGVGVIVPVASLVLSRAWG